MSLIVIFNQDNSSSCIFSSFTTNLSFVCTHSYDAIFILLLAMLRASSPSISKRAFAAARVNSTHIERRAPPNPPPLPRLRFKWHFRSHRVAVRCPCCQPRACRTSSADGAYPSATSWPGSSTLALFGWGTPPFPFRGARPGPCSRRGSPRIHTAHSPRSAP